MEKTPPRQWDLPSALLMLMAVLFSAWRLQTAGWVEGLGQVRNAAVSAYLLGLALGYSRYQKRGVTVLTLGYTGAILTWQLLGTIEFNPDQTQLLDKLTILFGRLFTDIGELLAGRDVEDQFFVIALFCLPYWFASLYGGFQLTRHANFLGAVLPNGILMFIIHANHYTVRDYTWMFSIYLFLALVLLSRLKYLSDRRKWTQARVQVSSESGLDIANTAITAATVLLLLVWSTPYILPASAAGREFWRNTYGEVFPPGRFDNIFASVDKEKQPTARNFQTDLLLGSRTPQSDLVIFRVYAPNSAADFPRLYWRGQVYDHYENGHWQTTGGGEERRESTNGDIPIPDEGHRRRLGFTFDVLAEQQSVIYTPAQPVWVNHDAIVLRTSLPGDGEDSVELLDVMAMRASPALEAGDLYRSGALLANPTIPELRAAGQAYPDWVKEKYLQLPEGFSPRIRALAAEIAKPYDNPFDQASAITDFLRSEIEYNSAVYIPNDTDDPLEYVLFESRQGFCNYYATLEVLMLRSLGIPARLAVGYAQGEPNLQNSIYVVRERDLHAWPEVYFPEYGWVEFEPTGNQDPLQRPLARDEAPAPAPFANPALQQPFEEEDQPPAPNLPDEEEASAKAWQNGLASALPWLGGVFFILLGIVLTRRFAPNVTAASILKRAIERSGWSPPRWLAQWLVFVNRAPIERYFHSVNLSLHWMKRPQAVHITAAERAWVLKHILPSALDSIETLLREHQAQLFSPRGGNDTVARRAAWDILAKTLQRRVKIFILGYNYTEVQEPPRYPL